MREEEGKKASKKEETRCWVLGAGSEMIGETAGSCYVMSGSDKINLIRSTSQGL